MVSRPISFFCSLGLISLIIFTDPESNGWDPLDGELSKKLDSRPYVSLSRDRSSNADDSPPKEESVDLANEEALSLFDIHMPGVLTLDQVNALNLGNWNLLYHGTFVHFSVSRKLPSYVLFFSDQTADDDLQDLVGWEKMAYNNPQSVKGIVGELAAALGPEIVKDSAVVLFD